MPQQHTSGEHAPEKHMPEKEHGNAEHGNKEQGNAEHGSKHHDSTAHGDDTIDFGKLKRSLGNFFTKSTPHAERTPQRERPVQHSAHSESPSDTFNYRDFKAGFQKHAKWLIPLVCILIAVFFSVFLRTMPLRMPIAEDWAENTVRGFYSNQLQEQISQQYPNLPSANRDAILKQDLERFLGENKQIVQQQKAELAEQYRNQFRDDAGTLYLLGIDPYYYFRQAYYVLENGYPGTSIREGKIYDDYRLAPIGREQEWNLHNWFGAIWHRFLNFFGNYPLMLTFFLVGTFFSALTVIPGFFIGRRITQNSVGGFFVAMLLAVSAFFVARTTGESSDTDVYSVFFPVLIAWLFLESLYAENGKKSMLWAALAGLATGAFAFAWTGWWYVATFILAALVIHIAALLAVHWKEIRSQTTKAAALLKEPLLRFLTYGASTAVFVSLLTSPHQFLRVLLGPFQFMQLKAVAVTSYWPNIRTTVAELNVTSFQHVVEQLDGRLLFVLSLLGIAAVLLLKDRHGKRILDRNIALFFFLAIWMLSSLYATTKGVRFILQVTPIFSIALGAFMGIVWQYASRWLSRELKIHTVLMKTAIFILLALLLIAPVKSGYSQAYNSIPGMNDGWYNALQKINNEAPENSIITSWWDFGHWFKAIANRPVTFDGGTQVGYGAHWVGKTLLADDEKLSAGIIRMLNCGQNTAFDTLHAKNNDTLRSIALLNQIAVQDKKEAGSTLQEAGLSAEDAAGVLQYTHCEAPVDYFITSEDMVGKAGVWGHFGSWNFRKAVMYQQTRGLPRPQAVAYLTEQFNLSEEEADRIHGEIQTTDADRWISGWPGYLSRPQPCEKVSATELQCAGGLQNQQFLLHIDLQTGDVSFEGNSDVKPNSLVYPTEEGVVKKELEGQKTGFSVVLIPDSGNYRFMLTDPLQAASLFTRLFYLEGHGMKCFRRFDDRKRVDNSRIITWVVDYDCGQENKVFFSESVTEAASELAAEQSSEAASEQASEAAEQAEQIQEQGEQVRAAHILISTDGRTEDEALAFALELRKNVTGENFAEYAARFSEDPGSGPRGGELGFFGRGVMVKEFEEAAFSLAEGEISEPVKTQFGYHLVYLIERR